MKLHLKSISGSNQITTVNSSSELMSSLRTNIYTHLIINIIQNDGNTLEILPNIYSLYPQLKILVYSIQQPIEIYANILKKYNIHYYLNKIADEESTTTLLYKFFQKEDSRNLVLNTDDATKNPFTKLSSRELEVLHYLIQGTNTKEIAETLNLKMNSISTFKQRIYLKTGCKNQKELLQLAGQYHIS